MAEDRFGNERVTLESPAEDAFSISPSNTADLPWVTRGILLGTSGDLAIQTKRGNEVLIPNLSAGIIHPIRAKRVLQSTSTSPAGSTTAGRIVGFL